MLIAWSLLLLPAILAAQKFYPDDPLKHELPPRPVGELKERKLSDYYDLFSHQFATLGERQPEKGPPIRALGTSSIGEPLEGAWWVQRHYYQRMTLEQLRAGAGTTTPAPGKWTVVSAKNEGVTPGFVILDSANRRFFIKFDPLTNPEMATSADAITSRLFYAMGYHVPENNLVYFERDQLELKPNIKLSDAAGKVRNMRDRDLTEILIKVPKTADGRYRATASLALPGRPIGPPRYYGTRTDDPNDVVPHEHRRDQRGLHVIDAWVDHDDSRAINNLDAIVELDGVRSVRHYHLDFGSTLGSATQKANSPRSGAYFFSWKESAKQLFTLGLVPQYWALADYPDYPSVGKFEWEVFDPERWVPEYPNPAFLNRLPDDEFWGAKLVTAFTEEEIRAIVGAGQLSDKKAEDWLVQCLIERRNKIGRAYFAKLLPLDRFQIEGNKLNWDDVGHRLGYTPAVDISIQWADFDNSAGTRTPITGAQSAELPQRTSGYSVATLTSKSKPSHRVEVFVRYGTGGVEVVGVERFW